MLEKGRGLIADGFFFIAPSLPRKGGVGKPQKRAEFLKWFCGEKGTGWKFFLAGLRTISLDLAGLEHL
jgi:hypothetical protein